MKTLSLLFSLLLGAAVLFIFVQPWGALEKLLGVTATREAAPAKPLAPPDSTASRDHAGETCRSRRAAACNPAARSTKGRRACRSQGSLAGSRKG
jgi:hypothetical protein